MYIFVAVVIYHAHVQTRLKFVSKHLNDSENVWEKVLWVRV